MVFPTVMLAHVAQGTECHQIIVEDWAKMEQPYGTLFLSMPSLLDSSLCPPGTHVIHAFTPDWIDNWKVREQLSAVLASSPKWCSVSTAGRRACCKAWRLKSVVSRLVLTTWHSSCNVRSSPHASLQGLSPAEYEQKKEEVADNIAARLEPYFPGIRKAIVFRSVVIPAPYQVC